MGIPTASKAASLERTFTLSVSPMAARRPAPAWLRLSTRALKVRGVREAGRSPALTSATVARSIPSSWGDRSGIAW